MLVPFVCGKFTTGGTCLFLHDPAAAAGTASARGRQIEWNKAGDGLQVAVIQDEAERRGNSTAIAPVSRARVTIANCHCSDF